MRGQSGLIQSWIHDAKTIGPDHRIGLGAPYLKFAFPTQPWRPDFLEAGRDHNGVPDATARIHQ